MLKHQRGIGLSKLLMVCVVVGLVALLGIKVTPEYIEYFKILNSCKAISVEANTNQNTTVADVKKSFDRRAEIDHIKDFSSADLDVVKDGNEIVVSFAYTRKIPLFKNISLLIDFSGSSAK